MKVETIFVGVNGKEVVSSKETIRQIKKIRDLECALELEQEKVTWDDLDNSDKPRTLFQSILADRLMRVDQHTFMADRPSFCVVTAIDGKAVRLEFYEGHDALSLVYDLRSKELQDKDLPNFMDCDPQAYDPIKYLKDAIGIPENLSKTILDELHRIKKED